VAIRHKWGQNQLLLSTNKIDGIARVDVIKRGLILRFNDYKAKEKDNLFLVADWLLRHWHYPTDDPKNFDVQKKFEEHIDEMERNKARMNAADQAKLAALQKVRDELKKPLAEPQEELRVVQSVPGMAEGYKTLSKDHYVLLHPDKTKVAEARVKRLERLYAGFFYWFALQGQPLPAPQRKLVCVLAESDEKFKSLHQVFDSIEHVADGFYAPIENIAILAPSRVDSAFDQLRSKAGEIDKQFGDLGFDLTKLLKGDKLPKKVTEEIDSGRIAYGQMMALAMEAAKEEGEVATVTHEGTQQLAAATGLLSRHVRVPSAVRMGLGCFFETPKSAGDLNLVSLWSGIGDAHWVYAPLFKRLASAEAAGTLALDEKNATAKPLRIDKLNPVRILTDGGFERADKAEKGDKDSYRTVARAEAWALTHYLMREKLSNLRRFYAELSQLPRDMDLTPEIIEMTFARAFDLVDAGNPDRIDQDKLAALERAWKNSMGYVKLEEDPNREPKEKPRATN
jgi:hypothetical protein